jgi:hypothetical protein
VSHLLKGKPIFDVLIGLGLWLSVAYYGYDYLTQTFTDPNRDIIAVEYTHLAEPTRIYGLDPDGIGQDCSQQLSRLSTGKSDARQPSWSPDREHIVYTQLDDIGYWNLRKSDITWHLGEDENGSSPSPGLGEWLTGTDGYHSIRPHWSPNGRYIAYLRVAGDPGDDLDSLFKKSLELRIVDLHATGDDPDFGGGLPWGFVSNFFGWVSSTQATLAFADLEGTVTTADLASSSRQVDARAVEAIDVTNLGDSIADIEISFGPDGGILYSGNRRGDSRYRIIYAHDLSSGLGEERVEGNAIGPHQRSPVFSPDGSRIAHLKGDTKNSYQVQVAEVDGDGLKKSTPLTECPGSFASPAW